MNREDKDCRKCQDWGECTGFDYYSPSQIQFCRWQMLWLLWHLEELESGIYPSLTSSSLDWPPTLAKGGSSAYFETIAGLVAIITQRLKRTGKDGKRLLAQVKLELNDFAITLYCFYQSLDEDAKLALGYISGRWPKRENALPRIVKTPYYIWRWRKQHKSK